MTNKLPVVAFHSPVQSKLFLLCLFISLLMCGATSVSAQTGITVSPRVGISSNNFQKHGLGLRFDPFWTYSSGKWNLSVSPEVELSHLRYSGNKAGPGNLNQVAGSAAFRVTYGDSDFRPYAEVGLGGSWLSRDKLGDKELSTHFQFTEYIGAGVEFKQNWYAGLQYIHISNADIKKPNDGLDLYQFVLGFRF